MNFCAFIYRNKCYKSKILEIYKEQSYFTKSIYGHLSFGMLSKFPLQSARCLTRIYALSFYHNRRNEFCKLNNKDTIILRNISLHRRLWLCISINHSHFGCNFIKQSNERKFENLSTIYFSWKMMSKVQINIFKLLNPILRM